MIEDKLAGGMTWEENRKQIGKEEEKGDELWRERDGEKMWKAE